MDTLEVPDLLRHGDDVTIAETRPDGTQVLSDGSEIRPRHRNRKGMEVEGPVRVYPNETYRTADGVRYSFNGVRVGKRITTSGTNQKDPDLYPLQLVGVLTHEVTPEDRGEPYIEVDGTTGALDQMEGSTLHAKSRVAREYQRDGQAVMMYTRADGHYQIVDKETREVVEDLGVVARYVADGVKAACERRCNDQIDLEEGVVAARKREEAQWRQQNKERRKLGLPVLPRPERRAPRDPRPARYQIRCVEPVENGEVLPIRLYHPNFLVLQEETDAVKPGWRGYREQCPECGKWRRATHAEICRDCAQTRVIQILKNRGSRKPAPVERKPTIGSKEAAEILGEISGLKVTRQYVWEWARQGKLPVVEMTPGADPNAPKKKERGGAYRFYEDEIRQCADLVRKLVSQRNPPGRPPRDRAYVIGQK